MDTYIGAYIGAIPNDRPLDVCVFLDERVITNNGVWPDRRPGFDFAVIA